MGIHHNVLAKAARNGITIAEYGNEFICTKDGAELARDVTARDALSAAIDNMTTPATDKEDTDVAKTAKKTAKAKKAPKAKKDNGAAKAPKTIVSDEYRANYNADDNCGDAVAKAITAMIKDGKLLNMEKLKKLAEDNDVDLKKWSSLNNGQQSMNLRNVLRARAKRGEKVKIAGRIFEV